jgi:hypothetical protein
MKLLFVPGVISNQPIPKVGEWNFKNLTTYPKGPTYVKEYELCSSQRFVNEKSR